jgi:hypothetical protein
VHPVPRNFTAIRRSAGFGNPKGLTKLGSCSSELIDREQSYTNARAARSTVPGRSTARANAPFPFATRLLVNFAPFPSGLSSPLYIGDCEVKLEFLSQELRIDANQES